MPEMDGISVLKALRNSYSKLQLPIVLVTSRGSSSEIVQALDFGANDYVSKSLSFKCVFNNLFTKEQLSFS